MILKMTSGSFSKYSVIIAFSTLLGVFVMRTAFSEREKEWLTYSFSHSAFSDSQLSESFDTVRSFF